MNITRRTFIKLFSFIGLFTVPLSNWATAIKGENRTRLDRATLNAYLDTLVPEDQTPSATSLGVAERLLAKAAADSQYYHLLASGFRWLNQQARVLGYGRFPLLPEKMRESVVTKAATSGQNSLTRRFFATTRDDTFFYYYAHPESQTGLAYAGPTQPHGFMDYTEKPSVPK